MQQWAAVAAGALVLSAVVVAVARWSRAVAAIFPDAARKHGLIFARRSVGSWFTGRGEHLTLHGVAQGVPLDVVARRERTGRYRSVGTTIAAAVPWAVRPCTVTVTHARPLHALHQVSTGDDAFDTQRFVTCDAPEVVPVMLTPPVRAALLRCPQHTLRLALAADRVVLAWDDIPGTALELQAPLELALELAAVDRPAPADVDTPARATDLTPDFAPDPAPADQADELSRLLGFPREHLQANRQGRLHPEQVARLVGSGRGEVWGLWLVGSLFAVAGVAGGIYNFHDRLHPTLSAFAVPAVIGLMLAGACLLGADKTRRQLRARSEAVAAGVPQVVEGPVDPWEIRGHGVAPRCGFNIGGRTFASTRSWNAMLTPGAHCRVYHVHDCVIGIEPTREQGSPKPVRADALIHRAPVPQAMNHCAEGGLLVNATNVLPGDPTDVHVDGLPAVGCSHLRCVRCQVDVRQVVGLDLRHQADCAPSRLAVLYDTADLAASPAFTPIDPTHRVYLCRCTRWLEKDVHACREPDFDPYTDPDVPWACAGHPVMTLPHDLDGTAIPDPAALFDVVMAGLRGIHPVGTRPADQVRGDWVTRLLGRLGPEDAAVVVRAARAALHAPAPRTRAGALYFLHSHTDAVAQAQVLEWLIARSPLLLGVPDAVTPYPQAHPTLEDAAWRVIERLVAAPGPARSLARQEVLAGRGRRAMFTALAANDSSWLMAHVEPIVQAAPALAPALDACLGRLPLNQPRKAVRARIAAAATAVGTAAPVAPVLPAAGSLSFEQALAHAGPVIAAWDHQSDDDLEIRLYAVGSMGAHHLASRQAAPGHREALEDEVLARGLRVGGAWPWSGHVWVMDEAGFAVWSGSALLAEGTRTALRLRDGDVLPGQVATVASFVDPADPSHRGVRCHLAGDGRAAPRVVAEAFAPPSETTFDAMDSFDDDVRWAVYVGAGLAMWLGVPHVRFDGSVRNGDALEVAAAARALAAQVEALPPTGAFDPLVCVTGSFGNARDLTLRVAADGNDGAWFIEAKVWNPQGTRWRARWVKQGTGALLAAWLRRAATPEQLLRTAGELADLVTREEA